MPRTSSSSPNRKRAKSKRRQRKGPTKEELLAMKLRPLFDKVSNFFDWDHDNTCDIRAVPYIFEGLGAPISDEIFEAFKAETGISSGKIELDAVFPLYMIIEPKLTDYQRLWDSFSIATGNYDRLLPLLVDGEKMLDSLYHHDVEPLKKVETRIVYRHARQKDVKSINKEFINRYGVNFEGNLQDEISEEENEENNNEEDKKEDALKLVELDNMIKVMNHALYVDGLLPPDVREKMRRQKAMEEKKRLEEEKKAKMRAKSVGKR